MRRLVFIFALLVLSAAAAFAGGASSEVLLAPDGTLFSVEVVRDDQIPKGSRATSALRLWVSRPDQEPVSKFVPASLSEGRSSNPALAYDNRTETLFVFWVRAPQITTSELLICSYKNGAFSEPTVLDGGVFRLRQNLQIAVTRFAVEEESSRPQEAVAIHAIWWDTDGWDERARYALLQIEDGRAVVADVRNAAEFVSAAATKSAVLNLGSEGRALTFPTVTAAPGLDRVEVTFGDKDANKIHRVDLVPVVADGVLRPPIGIRRGEIPAPVAAVGADSTVVTITDPVDNNSLLVYAIEDSKVSYMVYENESWSEIKSIALDGHVTEAQAIAALEGRLAER